MCGHASASRQRKLTKVLPVLTRIMVRIDNGWKCRFTVANERLVSTVMNRKSRTLLCWYRPPPGAYMKGPRRHSKCYACCHMLYAAVRFSEELVAVCDRCLPTPPSPQKVRRHYPAPHIINHRTSARAIDYMDVASCIQRADDINASLARFHPVWARGIYI